MAVAHSDKVRVTKFAHTQDVADRISRDMASVGMTDITVSPAFGCSLFAVRGYGRVRDIRRLIPGDSKE